MLTPHEDDLAVLIGHGHSPDLMELPWEAPSGAKSLDDIASALADRVAGTAPTWRRLLQSLTLRLLLSPL